MFFSGLKVDWNFGVDAVWFCLVFDDFWDSGVITLIVLILVFKF